MSVPITAQLSPRVRALLDVLPPDDMAALRRYFSRRDRSVVPPEFAAPVPERLLDSRQMTTLETVLLQRVETCRNGRERLARRRLWFIFIMLRWQALRLAEVLALDDAADVRLDTGTLQVRGSYARTLSLPPEVCVQLREFFSEPSLQAVRGSLCAVDAGFLRRSLYACAAQAGLPHQLVSARVLRNSRAVELCRQGLPLPVVHNFLGLTDAEKRAFLHYSPEDTLRITQEHMQRSMAMKTSARNVFVGRITALRQMEFMVNVELTTAAGLRLDALITEESRVRLELCEGKIVAATVKAPFVLLDSSPQDAAPRVNNFAGVVRRVRTASFIEEVDVELDAGGRVCALLHTEDGAGSRAEGDRVRVYFKAFSVVIGLV